MFGLVVDVIGQFRLSCSRKRVEPTENTCVTSKSSSPVVTDSAAIPAHIHAAMWAQPSRGSA
jgi:hypothetical protein